MNIKKLKFITFFITLCLTFLCHFMYDWFPNTLTSIFFPVNESIWEHMKMLFTTILIGGLIEYIIIKKQNLKFNNILLILFFKSLVSIPIFLLFYLPLYYIFGENMVISITIMTIVLILIEIFSFYLLHINEIKYQGVISIVLIILSYIIFSLLTYYPPKTELFYDKTKNKYGINHYEI